MIIRVTPALVETLNRRIGDQELLGLSAKNARARGNSRFVPEMHRLVQAVLELLQVLQADAGGCARLVRPVGAYDAGHRSRARAGPYSR